MSEPASRYIPAMNVWCVVRPHRDVSACVFVPPLQDHAEKMPDCRRFAQEKTPALPSLPALTRSKPAGYPVFEPTLLRWITSTADGLGPLVTVPPFCRNEMIRSGSTSDLAPSASRLSSEDTLASPVPHVVPSKPYSQVSCSAKVSASQMRNHGITCTWTPDCLTEYCQDDDGDSGFTSQRSSSCRGFCSSDRTPSAVPFSE